MIDDRRHARSTACRRPVQPRPSLHPCVHRVQPHEVTSRRHTCRPAPIPAWQLWRSWGRRHSSYRRLGARPHRLAARPHPGCSFLDRSTQRPRRAVRRPAADAGLHRTCRYRGCETAKISGTPHEDAPSALRTLVRPRPLGGEVTEHTELNLGRRLRPEPVGDYITARQIEEDLNVVLDSAVGNAFLPLDPTGRVATSNRDAGRLTGFRADHLFGRHVSIFGTPADAALGRLAPPLEVAANGKPFDDEGLHVHRDGSRFWAQFVISTLRDQTRRVRGFVSVSRDRKDSRQVPEAFPGQHANLRTRSAHVSLMGLACFVHGVSSCN